MKNTSKTVLGLIALSCVSAGILLAFPDQEKATVDFISTQPSAVVVSDDNRYVFFGVGDRIIRGDLASWEETPDQVPELTGDDFDGGVEGLAIRNDNLYATQSDGDIIIVDLNDITATPRSVNISTGALGSLVADTTGTPGTDQLYVADTTANQILVFDIGDETVTASIPLRDDLDAQVTPLDLVFDERSGNTNKVYVSSGTKFLFEIPVGVTTATRIDLSQGGTVDAGIIPALAVSPSGETLFAVDSTNTTVHVLDVATNLPPSTTAGSDLPIDLLTGNENNDLRDILVTPVLNPTDTYAYVSGGNGLSLIDLNFDGGGVLSSYELLTRIDLAVSSPIFVFAASDEYVLTVNGNAQTSVITENPFVTITSTSLDGQTLTEGESFTIVFESDEAGTYEVRVGGDIDATGTLVDSGTVPAANSPVTTNEITDSGEFQEGSNDVFVFVTDDQGNRGRDMIQIDTDIPPEGITIRSTGFGDQKAFITFDRLEQTDIVSYNIYADPSASVVMTKSQTSGTVDQPDSGSTVTGEALNLINGTLYFLAVEAVDSSGNVGPRVNTFPDGTFATAIPQGTIGLTQAVGELGCALLPERQQPAGPSACLFGLVTLIALAAVRLFRVRFLLAGSGMILLAMLVLPPAVSATELSPQWFSWEFKVGNWFYTDGTTDEFMSKCCNILIQTDFGLLIDSKYGIEFGAGFLTADRNAIGAVTGGESSDRFNLTLVPMQLNGTFRADFKENQVVVPYVKVGPDFVYFRQNLQGDVTDGVKYGLHATLGLMITMEFWDEGAAMEKDWGVNDVYFVLEGEYAWINDFGRGGLDLSGVIASAGILFEF